MEFLSFLSLFMILIGLDLTIMAYVEKNIWLQLPGKLLFGFGFLFYVIKIIESVG